MTLRGRNLLAIGDLTDDELEELLALAGRFAAGLGDGASFRHLLDNRIVCTAFFEPSTRTRLSFEAAAHRLGAQVIGFADASTTSGRKGETLEDTGRILSGYADLIVTRHFDAGAAVRMATGALCPVVNAGDGAGEHPTQTLVDLFTLRSSLGPLAGRRVAVVGDLRYGRTVHSLVPALRRAGARIAAVPAPGLELPENLAQGVEETTMEEAAATCDALYVTRVQKERFPEGEAGAASLLHVNRALLERTRSKAIILHPLPRVDELSTDLDILPAAKYFDQAQNGVAVRMAILVALLGAPA